MKDMPPAGTTCMRNHPLPVPRRAQKHAKKEKHWADDQPDPIQVAADVRPPDEVGGQASEGACGDGARGEEGTRQSG